MSSKATNVRRAAVSALRAWAKGHTYMDSLIERHAAKNSLSRQDRALLQSIVSSVLRNRRLLDHWIGKLRKGKLDHETRDILRVGLCQLLILGLRNRQLWQSPCPGIDQRSASPSHRTPQAAHGKSRRRTPHRALLAPRLVI